MSRLQEDQLHPETPSAHLVPAAHPPILSVAGLQIESASRLATRNIVAGIDLRIERGGRLGLVGESGSGKSLTAGAVMGLLPRGLRVASGSIEVDGTDVLSLDDKGLRAVRGRIVSAVPQNALSSLNPMIPVGRQISDVARAHLPLSRAQADDKAVALLDEMGLPEARRRAKDFPHQFSGGMAQRISIAMALVCRPRLVIADEPTTGLDTTIQRQVLETMDRSLLRDGAALLLISHDLNAVAKMTDTTVVLYAGMVLEHGPTNLVMTRPLSPYSIGLVRSSDPDSAEISFIPGQIPAPGSVTMTSCPFAARCELASGICARERPALRPSRDGRLVACHNVELS